MGIRESPEGNSNSLDLNIETKSKEISSNLDNLPVSLTTNCFTQTVPNCISKFIQTDLDMPAIQIMVSQYEQGLENDILPNLGVFNEHSLSPSNNPSNSPLCSSPFIIVEGSSNVVENSEYDSCEDEKQLFIPIKENNSDVKPINLPISKIVEFDCSEASSDSECQSNRRMSNRRSRTGTRIKGVSDEIDSNDEICGKSSESSIRCRRHGVSAEPVRVSWGELRESFKKSRTENVDEIIEQFHEDKDKEERDSPTGSTGNNCLSSVSLPIIEVQDEDRVQSISIDDGDSSTPQKKHSLQVPPLMYEPAHMALLIPSTCQVLLEDVELERKYHHAVFSFNTDQFTLQKRLENQERARDVAESGIDRELSKLRNSVKNVQSLDKATEDYEEMMMVINRHFNVLHKSAMKVSAQSEQHGCYQQEHRMKDGTEVMIAYVEQLKIKLTKVSEQLDRYKNQLQEAGFEESEISDDCRKSTDEVSGLKTNDADTEIEVLMIALTAEVEEFTLSLNDSLAGDSLAAPSKNTNRFSIISKSLMVTKRMKRHHQQNDDTPTRQLSSRKRVSFGHTSIQAMRRESGEEIDLSAPSNQSSKYPKIVTKICLVIILLVFVPLTLYFCYVFMKNPFEVDTLRLYDILLRYIPHTIEYQKEDTDDAIS